MEDDVRLIKEIVTRLEQSYQEERRTYRETISIANAIRDELGTELRIIRDRVTQIEHRQINNLEILEHLATQIAEIRSKFS